jgi:hypothetical protein
MLLPIFMLRSRLAQRQHFSRNRIGAKNLAHSGATYCFPKARAWTGIRRFGNVDYPVRFEPVSYTKSLLTGNLTGKSADIDRIGLVSNTKNARFMATSLKIPYSE